MDRPSRIVARGALALLIGASVSSLGCRNTRSEIPPSRPVSTTGEPAAPGIGFSSDPRPDASAAGGVYNGLQQASAPGGLPQTPADPAAAEAMGGRPQFGTPIGNQNSYRDAVPAEGRFGPPGTSTLPPVSGLPLQPPAGAGVGAPLSPPPSQGAASALPTQGLLGVDLPGAPAAGTPPR